jgi:AraC-like DNA-binding protein
MLARDVLEQEARRAELATCTGRIQLERTIRRFIDLMDLSARDAEIVLRLPITLTELAQMVDVSREHLYGLLAELETESLLRRRRGALVLPASYWDDELVDVTPTSLRLRTRLLAANMRPRRNQE